MNNFKVEFFNDTTKLWEDFTQNAVFPLKISNLLDEELDEAEIILKRASKDYFKPLTLVRITAVTHPKARHLISEPFNAPETEGITQTRENIQGDSCTWKETQETIFIVASDKSIEYPAGSGRYNHEIYLIESTKILEGYIGDSIAFTNPLGNKYFED